MHDYFLKTHQIKIRDFILKNKRCNIFAGCGMGKTFSTLQISSAMILYFLSGGSGGMADALDSGSSRSYPVRVQVSSSAFLLLGAVVLWSNGFFIFNKKRRTPKGSNIKFLTFFNFF